MYTQDYFIYEYKYAVVNSTITQKSYLLILYGEDTNQRKKFVIRLSQYFIWTPYKFE